MFWVKSYDNLIWSFRITFDFIYFVLFCFVFFFVRFHRIYNFSGTFSSLPFSSFVIYSSSSLLKFYCNLFYLRWLFFFIPSWNNLVVIYCNAAIAFISSPPPRPFFHFPWFSFLWFILFRLPFYHSFIHSFSVCVCVFLFCLLAFFLFLVVYSMIFSKLFLLEIMMCI